MNKTILVLSVVMGAVVLASNYLVQFPIHYYGLSEILTYGAFTYPIAFLITDLANRSYGKEIAKKIVYFGFFIGILFTLFFFNKLFRHNFNTDRNRIRYCIFNITKYRCLYI